MTFSTLMAYNNAQIVLIAGDENHWSTSEKVGHNPNFNEELIYWAESGAAARFAAINSHPGQLK